MNKNKKGTDKETNIEIPSSLTSGSTLKHIFEAAGKQPNTIPIEILELKAHKQSRALNILSLIITILLAVLIAVSVPIVIVSCSSNSGRITAAYDNKPVHIGDYMEGTDVVIQLKAGINPIDWNNIYAKNASGDIVSAVSIDQAKSTVTFPLDQGNLNIYISDTEGNTLQLVLNAQ